MTLPHQPQDEAVISPYDICWKCAGTGLGPTMAGDPDGNCWECKGYGTLRARDGKGRFIGNSMEHRT